MNTRTLLAAAGLLVALPAASAELVEYYHYVPPPATTYYVVPEPTYYVAPTVTVTAPRYDEQQRITYDVVDTLAADPYLSGKIGVQTDRDNEVELTGIVTTPGQARRAQRDAQSVYGVNNVRNELRTRVGGSP